MKASVIVPIYNRLDVALQCITGFMKQKTGGIDFRVVVVDDGSDEDLFASFSYKLSKWQDRLRFDNLSVIRCPSNGGRSTARNIGIDAVSLDTDVLIFSDGDRYPCTNFVREHSEKVMSKPHAISIGRVLEYVGDLKLGSPPVTRLSRDSSYYSFITNLYDTNGVSGSSIAWLSCLSGNMAIRTRDLGSTLFDKDFDSWGFEHFDFGLNLLNSGCVTEFDSSPKAANYHYIHRRGDSFYTRKIAQGAKLFTKKHSEIPEVWIRRLLLGDCSLQDFQQRVGGGQQWIFEHPNPIFNTVLNF